MKTHYEVLKLERNCSAKEIKDSFIKLSKEYHPDKNKNSDAHKRFIEVNEAYSVLGKTRSRNLYDETLSQPKHRGYHNPYSQTKRTTFEQYAEMYAKRSPREGSHQYINRSKISAVLFCCILMLFGSGIQLMAATHRNAVRREELAAMLKARKKAMDAGEHSQVFKELEKKLRALKKSKEQ